MESPDTTTVSEPVVSNIRTLSINNTDRRLADVKAGGKVITFRELDVVDSWDLAASTPENATSQWRNMALIALAVTDVDGTPVPPSRNGIDLDVLRQTMRSIGSDGLAAVAEGMAVLEPAAASANDSPEDAHRRAVGKSSRSAASGS